jgi:hypothetical protein
MAPSGRYGGCSKLYFADEKKIMTVPRQVILFVIGFIKDGVKIGYAKMCAKRAGYSWLLGEFFEGV